LAQGPVKDANMQQIPKLRTSLQGSRIPAVTAERSPSAEESSSLLGLSSSSSWGFCLSLRDAPYTKPAAAEATDITAVRTSVSIYGVMFVRNAELLNSRNYQQSDGFAMSG
jgi:hypothetical protein